MEVEHLDILVSAEVFDAIEALESLADQLLDVAEAQSLVDERYTIDVDVRGNTELERLNANLASTAALQGLAPSSMTVGGGAGSPTPTADGGGQAFMGGSSMDFLRRLHGIPEPSIQESFDMPGPMDDDGGGGGGGLLGSLLGSGTMFSRFNKFASGITASDINNLIASFVPLFATFVGALPAAIAGLGALAVTAFAAVGALAAITGLGLMGVAMEGGGGFSMEKVREVLSNLRDSLLDIVAPLAEQLAPVFERGLDGLTRFVEALVSRGDALTAFADDALAFGEFLITTIPQLLADLTRLADASSTVFSAIGQAFSDVDITEGLANIMAQVLPTLITFGKVVASMIPAIIELSVGFLKAATGALIVADVLGRLVGTLLTLGGVIPLDMVGVFVGLLLTATTAAALFTKVSGLLAGTMVASMIPSITGVAASLGGYIEMAIGASIATETLAWAIRGLLLASGVGVLLVTFGALASTIGDVHANMKKATRQLKRFKSQQSAIGGTSPRIGVGGGDASVFRNVNQEITIEGGQDRAENAKKSRYAAFKARQAMDKDFS